jgi:hypothetical protein
LIIITTQSRINGNGIELEARVRHLQAVRLSFAGSLLFPFNESKHFLAIA